MSSPSEEEVTSSPDPAAPCAGCKHLRRRCVPNCPFAPYFSPDDGDRFAAVHAFFGASNVSKMLEELEEEERGEAVDSLVYEALERQKDPTFGCVSYISILQTMLKHVKGAAAAAREELEGLGGPELQPFDAEAASLAARQAAEARFAAALRFGREQDDVIRARMQAEDGGEAAKWNLGQRHRRKQPNQQMEEAQTSREQMAQAPESSAPAVDGQIAASNQKSMLQRLAEAQRMTATVEAAKQQNMMMRQAAARAREQDMLRQLAAYNQQWKQLAEARLATAAADGAAQPAEQYQALGLEQPRQDQQTSASQMGEDVAKRTTAAETRAEGDLMMQARLRRQAAAEERYYGAAMARAQRLVAAEEIAREQDLMIRQAAADAGLTKDQYLMMMMMQQAVAAGEQQRCGQAEQDAGMGMTGDRNMTLLLQDVARQQQMTPEMANAQPLSAAAEMARQQDLMMMQQQAAAYAHAMPGSGSGAPTMPFLPGGSANRDAFLVQQQWQPQPQTVNAQFQEEPYLPPWLSDSPHQQQSFLSGGLADAGTFHVQQHQQPQLQTMNALGSQVEASLPPLPPSLADTPRQQQNDGGDEGQSYDLIATYWNQYPYLPPDDRQ